MSFVDLMGNTRWTPEDIAARAQRIVKQHYSRRRIGDLDDMLSGATAGLYTLTPEETAEIEHYRTLRLSARQAALEATADWELLEEVLNIEAAVRDGSIAPRQESFSTAEVLALYQARKPEPAVEETAQPQDPLEE